MQVVPKADIVYSLEGKAAGEVHLHSYKSPLPLAGRECVLLGHSSGFWESASSAAYCNEVQKNDKHLSRSLCVRVCTHAWIWKCLCGQPDGIGDAGQSSQNIEDPFLFPTDRIIHGMDAERAEKIISVHPQSAG